VINAAIADGDIVVVREQAHAQNGDIVAAMIDEETPVKIFQQVDGKVWLIPHNPLYEPIPWPVPGEDADIEDAAILGKVVAVYGAFEKDSFVQSAGGECPSRRSAA
jgi:repressor LexA